MGATYEYIQALEELERLGHSMPQVIWESIGTKFEYGHIVFPVDPDIEPFEVSYAEFGDDGVKRISIPVKRRIKKGRKYG